MRYDHELSLQLYSLKREAQANPAAMLASVPELGYTTVETAGDYGWSVEKWRAALDLHGLSVSGAHVVIERLEAELPAIADFYAKLGNFHLIVPVPPDGEGAERYRRCAERLNEVAVTAAGYGCDLSYHNHHWEFEDFGDGQTGMDILLADTDAELVKLQVDTAWALAGSGDVLGFLRRNRQRVRCLHAKEYGIAAQDEPPMGEGDVPFPEIVAMAVEEGWQITVEYESDGAPEGVRASASYLKGLLEDLEK